MITRLPSPGPSLCLLALAALLSTLPAGCGRWRPDASHPFDPAYPALNAVMIHHVSEAGVDYAALQGDRGSLDAAAAAMQNVTRAQFERWPPGDRLAFLINAHNAFAIQRIVDHYPVASLENTELMGSARNDAYIRLLGRKWSLRELADAVTGEPFLESRAIFLLNWAEASCPPLPRVPVTGDNLADLLDRQPRRMLAHPRYCQYDWRNRVIHLTPLLEDFRPQIERDFTTLWVFLQRYLPPSDAERLQGRPPRLRFMDWDHSLNDANLETPVTMEIEPSAAPINQSFQ